MSWLELHLEVPENRAELAEEALMSAGALSVTLTDNADQPILEPLPGTQPLWSQTRLVGLFPAEGTDTDLVLSLVRLRLPQDEAPARWQQLDERVWEREWLKHFQPIAISDDFWVHTQKVERPGATTLLLDPGLAFGTGTHPTTALCLEWIAAQDFANQEVIDLGCGSGILAIATLLRNARKAYCVDIDPQALTATENNMKRNGFSGERFELLLSADELHKQGDALIANILAEPLKSFSSLIAELVPPGGPICLSGILYEQADDLMTCYRPYFDNLQINRKEDWVAISGIRKPEG